MKLKSGHEVVPLSEEENTKLRKYFPSYESGGIRVNPGGWFFVPKFEEYADKLYDFKYKPSDVVIMTWPKCGTTWAQEIIWTMKHNADFNNEAAVLPIMFRSPFLEFDFIAEHAAKKDGSNKFNEDMKQLFSVICPGKSYESGGFVLEIAKNIHEPRIIKTHLAFTLLNPDMLDTCKVVYVARNPKDACISYLHHHRLIQDLSFTGDLDDFVDFYVNDEVMHSPFWEHHKEGWQNRNHKNLHWIFYEEMKRNPMNEIKRLNEFLGTNLQDGKLEEILTYTNFENMQQRDPMFSFFDSDDGKNMIINSEYQKKSGNFFRKGQSGDWRNHFNEEQNEKLEKWIKEKSDGIGIPFTY